MTHKFTLINAKFPHMLCGSDYNPDRRIRIPEISDEDTRRTTLAHYNAMSVGVFSCSALELSKAQFEFGWLGAVMDKLAHHGVRTVLPTPIGSKPARMSRTYQMLNQSRTY